MWRLCPISKDPLKCGLHIPRVFLLEILLIYSERLYYSPLKTMTGQRQWHGAKVCERVQLTKFFLVHRPPLPINKSIILAGSRHGEEDLLLRAQL